MGYRACFFLRTGGHSQAPFRGLNLGFATGDLPARVRRNRRDALQSAGLGPWAPVLGQQVHGKRLRVVTRREQGRGWLSLAGALPVTDGLLTIQPGLPVGVATADCLPVFLAATGKARAAAAIHAGWRGLVAGILPLAVKKMSRQWHIPPANIHAALGPAIGPQAFRVRGDVLNQLRHLAPEAVVAKKRTAPDAGFNLWKAARIQLRNAG